MILDDDDKLVYDSEILTMKMNLRRSHSNLLAYLRTTLGQTDI